MGSSSLSGLRTSLYVQAAFTALFAFAPSQGGNATWTVVQLVLAAGAVLTAVGMERRAADARNLGLGFEVVALLVSVAALMGHHYIPGTLVGLRVLVVLLSGRTSRAEQVTAAEPAPAAELPGGHVVAVPAPAEPAAPQHLVAAPVAVAPGPAYAVAPDPAAYRPPAGPDAPPTGPAYGAQAPGPAYGAQPQHPQPPAPTAPPATAPVPAQAPADQRPQPARPAAPRPAAPAPMTPAPGRMAVDILPTGKKGRR